MILHLDGVLTTETAKALCAALDDPDLYKDGRTSAGWAAKSVKYNQQASKGGRVAEALRQVEKALRAHAVFKAAARPKAFISLRVARYEPGMAYGWHVDDPLIGGKRTDLSFTLFLSDPVDYEGGELIIADSQGELDVKLMPGQAILYPTGALHQIQEVVSGRRIVIVGWVRSYVRLTEHRQILFDLDRACRQIHDQEGKSALFDQLMQTKTQLLRLWVED